MFSSSSEPSVKKFLSITAVCAWVLGSFVLAQYVVLFLFQSLVSAEILHISESNQTLATVIALALSYTLALVLAVGVGVLFKHPSVSAIKKQLAIDKLPKLSHIGLGVLGYIPYIFLTVAFTFVVQQLWAGFNIDQAQEVGFKNLANSLELMMAFFALVIIPPIAEEMLFRGYLFSHIRKSVSFFATAIIVSAAFGVAHQQLNVGIDVFALSLVLCFLREKTGTIWAGILLHMIKNGVAFVILFLKPDILQLISKG